MYLLAADVPPVPTSNSAYILLGAGMTAVVALLVALFTNRRADQREYQSWRREQLGTAVSSVHDKFAEIKRGIDHLPNLNRDQLLTLLRSTTDDVYRIQLVSSDWFAATVIDIIEEMAVPVKMTTDMSEKRTHRINQLQNKLILSARHELQKSRTDRLHQYAARILESRFEKRNNPIQRDRRKKAP